MLLQKKNFKPLLIVLAMLYGIVLWSNFIYSLKQKENASGTSANLSEPAKPVPPVQSTALQGGQVATGSTMQNGYSVGIPQSNYSAGVPANGYPTAMTQNSYAGAPAQGGFATAMPQAAYLPAVASPGFVQPSLQLQPGAMMMGGSTGSNWSSAYTAASPASGPAGSYAGMQADPYQNMPYSNGFAATATASSPYPSPNSYSQEFAQSSHGAQAGYPSAMHTTINQSAYGAYPAYSHGQAPVVRHRVVVTR
jgi:hypothetical protein